MYAGPELLASLLTDVRGKTSVVVLTTTAELVQKMAESFRGHLLPEGFTTIPSTYNPGFVNIVKAEWVLFIYGPELDETDQIGTPTYVYWPSQAGNYERLTYAEWKRQRPGTVWRPLTVQSEPRDEGPATAYDHLLD